MIDKLKKHYIYHKDYFFYGLILLIILIILIILYLLERYIIYNIIYYLLILFHINFFHEKLKLNFYPIFSNNISKTNYPFNYFSSRGILQKIYSFYRILFLYKFNSGFYYNMRKTN